MCIFAAQGAANSILNNGERDIYAISSSHYFTKINNMI